MHKKVSGVYCISFFVLVLALFSGCKNQTDSQKKIPNLTVPEVTLKLSDESPESTVIISWKPSNDADCYYVHRMNIREGMMDIQVVANKEDDEPLIVYDDTCESDTEYTYVVFAEAYNDYDYYTFFKYIDVFKETEYYSREYIKNSEKKIIKTAKDPKITLDYPKNVTVVSEPDKSNALTISWEPVEGALFYEVFFMDGLWRLHNERFEKIATIKETSFTKEHLQNEYTYCFRIRAIDENSVSLYSAKIEVEVPEATNISMDKAMMLTNGVWENINSWTDSVWFKCNPQAGIVKFDCKDDCTLSIFTEDGIILATGLRLFVTYEDIKNKDTSVITEQYDDKGDFIIRQINRDITDFTEGNTYILRVSKPKREAFSICVE